MIRVGIAGASGLAGGELLRLVNQHPDLELTFVGGSSNAGRRPAELHPGLRLPFGGLTIQPVTEDVADRCDVMLLATPAPVSASLAGMLADKVSAVVDLSGAFRIHDPELHARWYPKVARDTVLTDRFVYGVPELVADRLADARLISLPGCFATAITLGLAPLVDAGVRLDTVVVDGKTGSSGGGLQLRTADLHPLRDGAIAPYAPAGHRHAAEVRDFFTQRKSEAVGRLAMSAYGVSHVRGLLASSYVFTDQEISPQELHRTYVRYYKDQPFVRVRRHTETLIPVPDPQAVLGSNYCDVTPLLDDDGSRIVVLAALDNLVKGAAGQAIQAVNLRFGLPQTTGLTMQPVMPA